MIVSLFGPDGAGKTTIASQLAVAGVFVFSGTHVDEWPDHTWSKQFLDAGVDESSLNTETHFREKIRRCHKLVRELETRQGIVVVDSDPLHKTLLHHYVRTPSDADNEMASLWSTYERLAAYDNSKRLHVCVMISDKLSAEEQAAVLLERLEKSGNRDQFDPQNLIEALAMIQGSKVLADLLQDRGETVVVIENHYEPQTHELHIKITSRR